MKRRRHDNCLDENAEEVEEEGGFESEEEEEANGDNN